MSHWSNYAKWLFLDWFALKITLGTFGVINVGININSTCSVVGLIEALRLLNMLEWVCGLGSSPKRVTSVCLCSKSPLGAFMRLKKECNWPNTSSQLEGRPHCIFELGGDLSLWCLSFCRNTTTKQKTASSLKSWIVGSRAFDTVWQLLNCIHLYTNSPTASYIVFNITFWYKCFFLLFSLWKCILCFYVSYKQDGAAGYCSQVYFGSLSPSESDWEFLVFNGKVGLKCVITGHKYLGA